MTGKGSVRSILVVNEGGGPTTLVRGRQFAELFEKEGIRFDFVSRRPQWFAKAVGWTEVRWWRNVFYRVLRRLEYVFIRYREDAIVRKARDYDCVHLLWTPSWRLHEKLWKDNKTKIVMDVSDGLWLPLYKRGGYDGRGGFERVDDMLRHSHALSCENEYLAAYARKYNDNVHLTPDAPQLEEFDALRDKFHPDPNRVTLGWIGGGGSADHLAVIFEVLEDLFVRYPQLHLRILGAGLRDLPRFEKVRFSYNTFFSNRQMIEEALQMDIGLFPLYHIEDSKTRGTLKGKIYMSAGAVALCQRWGGAVDLIQHRENGVLADSPEEWRAELEWLITHPEERKRIAAHGIATIRENFTKKMCYDRLKAVFESA